MPFDGVSKLIHQVGDGIAEMRNIHAARKALKSVGFEILHEEDLADRK
jgi:sterol 24-C-methyltransferase